MGRHVLVPGWSGARMHGKACPRLAPAAQARAEAWEAGAPMREALAIKRERVREVLPWSGAALWQVTVSINRRLISRCPGGLSLNSLSGSNLSQLHAS